MTDSSTGLREEEAGFPKEQQKGMEKPTEPFWAGKAGSVMAPILAGLHPFCLSLTHSHTGRASECLKCVSEKKEGRTRDILGQSQCYLTGT